MCERQEWLDEKEVTYQCRNQNSKYAMANTKQRETTGGCTSKKDERGKSGKSIDNEHAHARKGHGEKYDTGLMQGERRRFIATIFTSD